MTTFTDTVERHLLAVELKASFRNGVWVTTIECITVRKDQIIDHRVFQPKDGTAAVERFVAQPPRLWLRVNDYKPPATLALPVWIATVGNAVDRALSGDGEFAPAKIIKDVDFVEFGEVLSFPSGAPAISTPPSPSANKGGRS